MRDRRLILRLALLLAGAAAAAPLQGQTSCSAVVVVPSRECFRQSDLGTHERHLGAKAPDYRYEGLAIGAVAGAAVGVVGSLAVCGQSDDPDKNCALWAVGGGLGLGLLGGLTGLLIGAQFPKEAPDQDTTEVAARHTVATPRDH